MSYHCLKSYRGFYIIDYIPLFLAKLKNSEFSYTFGPKVFRLSIPENRVKRQRDGKYKREVRKLEDPSRISNI